jgi:hypothetical protein
MHIAVVYFYNTPIFILDGMSKNREKGFGLLNRKETYIYQCLERFEVQICRTDVKCESVRSQMIRMLRENSPSMF